MGTMVTDAQPAERAALIELVTALADDELLLGHRDAEWTGLGPILEEDIAFSSMAQDEMGHALAWYEVGHTLGAPDADTQAYTRSAPDWRSAVLFELPRGDYAFSLVRQYCASLAQAVRYDSLSRSIAPEVAETARKLRQEEKYHLLHGRTLITRLAAATADSRGRVQAAVDAVWPYALGIWEPTADEDVLVAAGVAPDPAAVLASEWCNALVPFLRGCGLQVAAVPDGDGWRPDVEAVTGGRAGRHGPDLDDLLAALQSLRREEPEAIW